MGRSRITRKLDLDAFYQVSLKMIFYCSKLTGVSSDEVTPRSSTGHTLMALHCIPWILQQNLNFQRQAPEQKLCHKASWFYGMVTSRPFTYLEPSIAARSSGASLNRSVEIYVPVSSSWYLEPNETWRVIFVGFPTMFELIWHHQQTLPSVTLKSLRFFKIQYVGLHDPWLTHLCLYAKTKIVCMRTWKRESMYLRK